MRGLVVLWVACAVACSPEHRDEPGTCLPLPAFERSGLAADPDGDGLYWFESAYGYSFDAEQQLSVHLMRFDLRTRKHEVVVDRANAPLLFLGDKLVVTRSTDTRRVVLVEEGRPFQELTPDYLDVLDVEPLDDHTIAILAEGDGRRAVYTLDLDAPRPEYLADADTMFSTSAGRVYIRLDDAAFVVDARSATRTEIKVPKKLIANADGAIHVTSLGTVAVQSMSSGVTRDVVTDRQRWKLVHQVGSVLVRTPPKRNASFAWLLSAGERQELPIVLGGASIIGATLLRDQTWALIGHNTANFIGDLGDTPAESDVCLLPARGQVTFPTRQVPRRFSALAAPLFTVFKQATDDASLQIFDAARTPTTVFMRFTRESGGSDWKAMRARVRDLHARVTSTLGNREIKTELLYADRQTAILRWRRNRLRNRPSVGMGDALLNEPEDFDVESRELVNDAKDGRIRCTGTLVNLTAQRLDDVTIRCSSNRKHVVALGALAPGSSAPFASSFEIEEGEDAMLEAYSAGRQLEVRDPAVEARMQAVLDIAIPVHAETTLALDQHHVANNSITVHVNTDAAFEDRSAAERKAAIVAAYRQYEKLRDIYKLEPASPIELHVDVELTDVSYSFDGTNFTRND